MVICHHIFLLRNGNLIFWKWLHLFWFHLIWFVLISRFFYFVIILSLCKRWNDQYCYQWHCLVTFFIRLLCLLRLIWHGFFMLWHLIKSYGYDEGPSYSRSSSRGNICKSENFPVYFYIHVYMFFCSIYCH